MNEGSMKDYWRQWLSPGIVLSVLGWGVLLVGAWFRLEGVERKIVELSVDVKAATSANQSAEKESVRYQERLGNLLSRVESLERFREAQSDYNASTMSTLAVLKKNGGG